MDVRPGEQLMLSGGVSIELLQKSGQLARLRVVAPIDIRIEKRQSKSSETVPSMTK